MRASAIGKCHQGDFSVIKCLGISQCRGEALGDASDVRCHFIVGVVSGFEIVSEMPRPYGPLTVPPDTLTPLAPGELFARSYRLTGETTP
jgi:hypothetical protein